MMTIVPLKRSQALPLQLDDSMPIEDLVMDMRKAAASADSIGHSRRVMVSGCAGLTLRCDYELSPAESAAERFRLLYQAMATAAVQGKSAKAAMDEYTEQASAP